MILNLSIHNYALIRQLNIEPDKGLNIVTGETGAGKSIMLGAVGLLLGNRADTKSLLDKEQKCIIEGEFDIKALEMQSFFKMHDLDYEDHSIIRREINPKGKSRAFVNDVPVTLDILKSIGIQLIDIHSQNESIQLADKAVKLELIDGYAQSGSLLKDYKLAHSKYSDMTQQLAELEQREKESQADADYKSFLLDELIKSDLKPNEQELLEQEQRVLENSEEIKQFLGQIIDAFSGNEMSVGDQLREVGATLRKLSTFSDSFSKLNDRIDSANAELFDIIQELESESEQVEIEPARLDEVSARLDLINRLQLKHKVTNIGGLLDVKGQLENENLESQDLEESIVQLKTEKEVANKKMIQAAEKLSELRRSCIDLFSSSLNDLLREVGMPDGQLEVVYKRVEPWKLGIDEVELLFSANKGIKPESIGNVASGGEFSRLMFCVKYLLADRTAMPTVIFDEIDTGVSGEIAIKLAAMMKKMATNHQIIAISHLPQVAAKGQAHYFVYKDNSADKTESLIRRLEERDRLEEIAKMIGGDSLSETALNSARELIQKN